MLSIRSLELRRRLFLQCSSHRVTRPSVSSGDALWTLTSTRWATDHVKEDRLRYSETSIRQRHFHTSSVRREEMSAKEKKKALKAKAKAMAAEAEKSSKEDPLEAKKKALKEKLEAKKAAEEKPESPKEPEPDAPVAAAENSAKQEEPSKMGEEATPSPSDTGGSDGPTDYSTPELAIDAEKHKAGLADPDRPSWQNPLHHNNPDMEKVFPEDFDSPEEFEAAKVPIPPFDEPDGSVAAPEYLKELADEIVHLNMLEMNELVNKIGHHFGFHEGMLSPDEMADDDVDEGADAGGAPAAVEAKTVFDIKLVAFDAKAKIKVIKEVRSIAGLGLKEAKEMVESAPKVVLKDIKKEEAEEIKAKLEEIGATIEVV